MKNIPALTNERQKAFINDLYESVAPRKAAEKHGVCPEELRNDPMIAMASRAEAITRLCVYILPRAINMIDSMIENDKISRDKVALAKLVLDKAGVAAKPEDNKTRSIAEMGLADLHAALAKLEGKLKVIDQKPQASKAKLPSWLD